MKFEKIAVVGGDLRNAQLITLLAVEGRLSGGFGLELTSTNHMIKDKTQLEELIKKSNVVVGPIPFSNDGMTVNAPYHSERLYIHDLLRCMNKGQLLIGGKFDEKTYENAEAFGIKVVDILDREEMTVMNAIPTAEGAIQIAMEEIPFTIHGSRCLVLGYGRIGKVLSHMLDGLGATVYVTARKKSDLAWIECMGYKGMTIEKVEEIADLFDVVFNTIPAVLVNEHLLGKFRTQCLMIDLASKPGGIDFDIAKNMGLKTIWALSLPGRVAPESAARYIKQTIQNILIEMEG